MDPALIFLKEGMEFFMWLLLFVPLALAVRRYFVRRPSR